MQAKPVMPKMNAKSSKLAVKIAGEVCCEYKLLIFEALEYIKTSPGSSWRPLNP